MVDPQPTLVELLVGHVLLPRELLPQIEINSIVKHGLLPEGKQLSRCHICLEGRGQTFLLDYSYAEQSPAVKQQSVDMALNARGMRDTARVLHVSPTMVINELRKPRMAN
jgi:transposase-like protein